MGRKAACAPEREKQPSPPLPPIPLARSLAALSVDLGAFHAETVGKGGERGEGERRCGRGESRSLRALALEKAATALSRRRYGFLTDAFKALAHYNDR